MKFDLALTVCLMRYISDLHVGRVNPKHFDFALDEEIKKIRLGRILKEHVVTAGDVAGALAQVEPPYPGYRRTIQALHTYHRRLPSKMMGNNCLPSKKPIVPGDAYPGVPRLTRLLRELGDLPRQRECSGRFDYLQGPLVDAVKSFQAPLWPSPNGRIDALTLADLNVPLSHRVRQMQLDPRALALVAGFVLKIAPIVANIPEFRLRAYDKDFNIAVTMNVVVGKSYGHDTPVFSDTMKYVVFRPYWEVPYSITRAEIITHIVRDPDYLAKKGFEVVDSTPERGCLRDGIADVLSATPSRKALHPAKARPKKLARTR